MRNTARRALRKPLSTIGQMRTPIISHAGSTTGPTTSATRYGGMASAGTGGIWAVSEGVLQFPCPIDCTLSNLEVNLPVAQGSGTTSTISLRKNGAATALRCIVTEASTRKSDTTNKIAVAEGDLINWELVCSATAQTIMQVAALMTSVRPGESAIFGCSTATAFSTTAYLPPGAMRNTAAEADAQQVCATDGVIDKLYVRLSAAPGGSGSWTATLYKNGSPTSLTCAIADPAVSGNDCNPAHAVTIAAGDRISLELVATGTPTAAVVRFACRWKPTINGESLLFTNWNAAPAANSDRFNAANGTAGSTATESNTYSIVPYACTIKKQRLHATTGPGGTTRTRSIWLRAGQVGGSQADTTLTSVITDTATDANDGTHTYAAAAGDLLDLRTNSSASATSPVQLIAGHVAYIAPLT